MKIVILTQYFYPEMGAPSNRLLELSKVLIQKEWDVTVITAMPNYPRGKIFDDYKGKFTFKENKEEINILRYWLSASNSPKSLPRVFSMLTFSFTSLFSFSFLRKYKPEFFFVESPPLTLAFSAYLLSKFSKSKLIMNVSDIWPLTAKELGSINDGFLYRKIEAMEKFLYKKSDLCSGQSEEITEHIKKSGGRNVYLFRNGVDVNRFRKLKKTFEKETVIKIVYAGLLGVAQGVFDIAKNIDFGELGAEFHIYGEGAEKQKLEKYLAENPGRNIFLHKIVSTDEIPDLLPEFYCTIIPLVKNIRGAVPSKIYEAMAAGLPVLYSGAGEGAKIIADNNAGLVSPPKDFTSLKKNILRLKNSVDMRNEMSVNGRRAAEEKFDRIKIIDAFSKKIVSLTDS